MDFLVLLLSLLPFPLFLLLRVRRGAGFEAVEGVLLEDLDLVEVLDFVDLDTGSTLLVAVAFLVVVVVFLVMPNFFNLALLSSTTFFACSKAWF